MRRAFVSFCTCCVRDERMYEVWYVYNCFHRIVYAIKNLSWLLCFRTTSPRRNAEKYEEYRRCHVRACSFFKVFHSLLGFVSFYLCLQCCTLPNTLFHGTISQEFCFVTETFAGKIRAWRRFKQKQCTQNYFRSTQSFSFSLSFTRCCWSWKLWVFVSSSWNCKNRKKGSNTNK